MPLKISNLIPKHFLLVFLFFANIYAFNLPIVGNSAYWSLALIFACLAIFDGAFTNLRLLLQEKLFYIPIVVLVGAALFSILLPIIHNTSDFSMVKTWINNLLAYLCMGAFVALFSTVKNDYKDTFKLLFIIFLIQVLIIWGMLAIAPFRDIVQALTKSADSMARMETYGGARGLGFTSFIAFGLSVLMGLLALFMNYYFAAFHKGRGLIYKVAFFYLAVIAGISAGRTSIAGFVLGFYFFFLILNARELLKASSKSILYSAILVSPVVFYILSNPRGPEKFV